MAFESLIIHRFGLPYQGILGKQWEIWFVGAWIWVLLSSVFDGDSNLKTRQIREPGPQTPTVKREPFAPHSGKSEPYGFVLQIVVCSLRWPNQHGDMSYPLSLSFRSIPMWFLFVSIVSFRCFPYVFPGFFPGFFHVFSVRKPDLPCGFPMFFFPNRTLGISTARLPWSRMTTKSFGKPSTLSSLSIETFILGQL